MLYRLWSGLVRAGFNLLYTSLSPAYDTVARLVSRGDWQAWGRAALPYLRSGPVLELGVGTGHLLAHLAARAPLAVGIDRSPAMLRRATVRRGRSRLVAARAEALPFASGVFGTVVSTFPTPYIGSPRTLAEIARALVGEGRLIIVDDGQMTTADPYAWVINLAYRLTSRRIHGTPLPVRLSELGFSLSYYMQTSRHGRVAVLVADKAAARIDEAASATLPFKRGCV